MVSTRGGARTRPEDPKSSMLAQKPRRAAAKPAQTATTTKPKTTRSKKAAPEPEPEQTEDELQEQPEEDEEEAPAPVKKPTRKNAAATVAKEEPPKPTRRAARGAKKEEETSKPAPTTKAPAKAPAKSARPAITKTAKAKSTEDDKPKLPPPAPTKATRATRATAAKEKTAPLSPKKITQVSKAPARTTRTMATKSSSAKQAPAKATTRGRPAMRRNVSDENADVGSVKAGKDVEEEEAEEEEIAASTSKKKSTKKPAPKPVEEETPMSVPSTPDRETEHEDEMSEDELQDESVQRDGNLSESDDETEAQDASGDELCGPKTPMKRCSPNEKAKYASAQKTSEDPDVPMKTPTRRNVGRGTPKTQRLYNKPSFTTSESKPAPMTVARARDRAMVFPKLQPLAEAQAEKGAGEQVESEMSASDGNIQADTDVASRSPTAEEPSIGEIECAEDTMFDLGDEKDVMADAPLVSVTPSQHSEDPEETIIQDSEDEPVPEVEEEVPEVSDTDDSVMMLHNDADSSQLIAEHDVEHDKPMDDVQMSSSTVEPETMVWENIREDVTIPFNFDSDLTARALPQIAHNERLSILPVTQGDSPPDDEAATTEEPETATKGRLSIGSARSSLGVDATVNISDFIDVGSLSEAGTTAGPKTEVNHDSEPIEDSSTPSPLAPAVETASELEPTYESRGSRGRSLPRYALPTIASRSKSLPASPYRTPLKDHTRPKTSDGASMPRLAHPFRPSWLASPTKRASSVKKRPSTAFGMPSTSKRGRSRTPASRTPWAKTPGTSIPDTTKLFKQQGTPVARTLFARTPDTSVPVNSTPLGNDRFPALPARTNYEDFEPLDVSVTATPKPMVKERFPGLPPSETYEALAQTPVAEVVGMKPTPATRKSLRKERFPGLPSRDTYEEFGDSPDVQDSAGSVPVTPQPVQEERYPGLPHRRTYEEHAKTTMPASRFQTPPKLSVAKRPATTQKPTSLRKVALKASTPRGSRTPMKTPLRASAETPGQELMTPHPSAPLRGVVALAEVYTSDGSCATPAFTVLLQRLGAKTTKTFSERVTHVIFKEGSPQLLQRLRIHNKQVAETAIGNEILCVNSRWVSDCDSEGRRVDETDEIYAVDMGEGPRSAKRRRKSMEPTSLMNIGGNVVRDRKSSLGRSSLGRLKSSSPSEHDLTTPKAFSIADKENSGGEASPATPAYLAAPESLVTQTEAPQRVKLDFEIGRSKNRRQTFFPGA